MVKTWQVVLGTIVIFVAGLVTGGAVTLRLLGVREEHRRDDELRAQIQGGAVAARMAAAARPAPQEPQFGPALIRRFATQLNLTPAQFRKINPIVGRTQEELGRLRRQVQLGSALAIERMQDEIAGQLTPDQRSRFEELLKRQRARLQALIDERQRRQNGGMPPAPANAPAPPPAAAADK
jgi:Spy/CpxP family protein refolding chaperone